MAYSYFDFLTFVVLLLSLESLRTVASEVDLCPSLLFSTDTEDPLKTTINSTNPDLVGSEGAPKTGGTESDSIPTPEQQRLAEIQQVHTIEPSLRTLDQWRLLVSPVQARNKFVVVDPNDPTGLSYLNASEYGSLSRTCLSNGIALTVIGRPDTIYPNFFSSATAHPPKGMYNFVSIIRFGLSPSNRSSQRQPLKGLARWMSTPFRSDPKKVVSGENTLVVECLSQDERKHAKHEVVKLEGNLEDSVQEWAKMVHWWAGLSVSKSTRLDIKLFANQLVLILRTNGGVFLVKYLKVCLFAVNAYMAGTPLKDTRELGTPVALSNGLPSILPRHVRALIRKGHIATIRSWVSILNAYKAFGTLHPEPDLSTIQAPPMTEEPQDAVYVAGMFWNHLSANFRLPSIRTMLESAPFASAKAGPQGGPASHRALVDLISFELLYPCGVGNPLLDWLCRAGFERMYNAVQADLDWIRSDVIPKLEIRKDNTGIFFTSKLLKARSLAHKTYYATLGKLSLKFEPAGKVRVFAIVDIWTQWCLKPLHSWIFKILALLPSDATFDQQGRLEAFADRQHGTYWCYDLKAATDMIPSQLYVRLLTPIMGLYWAEKWIALLTERTYDSPQGGSVKYTRGQPMGALSSWAGLALVHHFLVFWAALRSNNQNELLSKGLLFTKYLILGDDIVIADEGIALQYLALCKELGIPIGLPKSFVSDRGFINFANQVLVKGLNLSPLSLKEELSVRGLPQRVESMKRMLSRGWLQEGRATCRWLSDYTPSETLIRVLPTTASITTMLRGILTPYQWAQEQVRLTRGEISSTSIFVLIALLAPPRGDANGNSVRPLITLLQMVTTGLGANKGLVTKITEMRNGTQPQRALSPAFLLVVELALFFLVPHEALLLAHRAMGRLDGSKPYAGPWLRTVTGHKAGALDESPALTSKEGDIPDILLDNYFASNSCTGRWLIANAIESVSEAREDYAYAVLQYLLVFFGDCLRGELLDVDSSLERIALLYSLVTREYPEKLDAKIALLGEKPEEPDPVHPSMRLLSRAFKAIRQEFDRTYKGIERWSGLYILGKGPDLTSGEPLEDHLEPRPDALPWFAVLPNLMVYLQTYCVNQGNVTALSTRASDFIAFAIEFSKARGRLTPSLLKRLAQIEALLHPASIEVIVPATSELDLVEVPNEGLFESGWDEVRNDQMKELKFVESFEGRPSVSGRSRRSRSRSKSLRSESAGLGHYRSPAQMAEAMRLRRLLLEEEADPFPFSELNIRTDKK